MRDLTINLVVPQRKLPHTLVSVQQQFWCYFLRGSVTVEMDLENDTSRFNYCYLIILWLYLYLCGHIHILYSYTLWYGCLLCVELGMKARPFCMSGRHFTIEPHPRTCLFNRNISKLMVLTVKQGQVWILTSSWSRYVEAAFAEKHSLLTCAHRS